MPSVIAAESGSMRCRSPVRSVAAAVALLLQPAVSLAQPTNADVLSRLISLCVMPSAEQADTLLLLPDPRFDFFRTAVVNTLKQQDRVVFLPPLTAPDTADAKRHTSFYEALQYHVESSSVGYAPVTDALERKIQLDARILLTSRGGEVLADTLCSRTFSDRITRNAIQRVEDPEVSITQGVQPRRGWLRRVAEPAVVAAASAVAVYLFFNVRSDKNNSQ